MVWRVFSLFLADEHLSVYTRMYMCMDMDYLLKSRGRWKSVSQVDTS